MYKKKIIGFFSINKINLKKSETTWSWYIGSDNHLPLGGFIPPFFYNWVFNKFKINKMIYTYTKKKKKYNLINYCLTTK